IRGRPDRWIGWTEEEQAWRFYSRGKMRNAAVVTDEQSAVLQQAGELGQRKIHHHAHSFGGQSSREVRCAVFICLAANQEQPAVFLKSKEGRRQRNEPFQRPILPCAPTPGMDCDERADDVSRLPSQGHGRRNSTVKHDSLTG